MYSHYHQSDYEGENTVVKDQTTFGIQVVKKSSNHLGFGHIGHIGLSMVTANVFFG